MDTEQNNNGLHARSDANGLREKTYNKSNATPEYAIANLVKALDNGSYQKSLKDLCEKHWSVDLETKVLPDSQD